MRAPRREAALAGVDAGAGAGAAPAAPAASDLSPAPVGPLRWIASALFTGQMYLAMALIGLVLGPLAIVDRRYAFLATRTWCRYVRWSAAWMIGLRSEVRGPVPSGEVLIAAKHQSFLDIILLVSVLERPKFVMKAELQRVPIVAFFARRTGCVPVERGRRAEAMRRMVADVERGRAEPGQLIIYPQGTRVAPGAVVPYKGGTAALYAASGQACVPAACNVGLFWARREVARRPGVAVVEFLPPIAPGLPAGAFMTRLEAEIEAASDRLMAEALRARPPAGRRSGRV